MREAAVAVIIITDAAPEVLVLKRRYHPDDPWSGHYSFPGGRQGREDRTLLDTCLRETYEECGIQLSGQHVLRQYPSRPAGNHLGLSIPVTSFLFELPDRPSVTLQTSEISAHEWLPVDYAADFSNIIQQPMSSRYPERLYPCLPAKYGVVWGFTLETLALVIKDHFSSAPESMSP